MAENRTLDFANARKDMEAAFPALQDPRFQVQLGLELVGLDTRERRPREGRRSHRAVAQDRSGRMRKCSMPPTAPIPILPASRCSRLSLAAPDSAQMHQLLAHEDTRQGNTDGAIAQYRKAIAIDPHLPGVHFELAELLHTSADEAVKKEAEQEYHAALLENPQDEKAILRLGGD